MQGTYRNGQVILDAPADWPEGCRVIVEPSSEAPTFGISESDWPETPEAIEEWLRWFDSLEPLIFTPEEEADLAAWRQKMRDHSAANAHKRIEGLFQ